MKILHFSWDTVIPGVGGSTHEWNIAKAFRNLGHSVRLICEWEYNNKVSEDLEGVDVRRVHWRVANGSINALILIFKAFFNSFYQIISFSPEVVYERYRILGGYGVIVGKLFNKRTILEVNDPAIDAPYIEGRIGLLTKILASLWERFVFTCSDKIITHHEVMAKRAAKKKVLVLTNGVNVKDFNPNSFERTKWKDKFVCLFIGTFAEWQGVETIINTAKLLEKNKKILFVLVGGDGEESVNTRFLGRLSYDEIPGIIANSDVCLYVPDTKKYKPMQRLGFYFSPLKIFEYMSMGKPVIVSNDGNLKTLVRDNINGYRVDAGNAVDLKEKVLKIYKNKKQRSIMSKNNRRACIKKYSWTSIARMVLK